MKPMNIDFAGASGAGHRGGARQWVLLAGVCAVLAIGAALAGRQMSVEAANLRAQARDMELMRDTVSSAAAQQNQLPLEVADSINGVIRMLDYPTVELLSKLERFVRPDVAVMSLEMGPVRSNLRLFVQAPSLPEALEFLEDLRTDPAFQTLALTRQELVSDANGAWRFSFEMPQADAVARAVSRNVSRGQE